MRVIGLQDANYYIKTVFEVIDVEYDMENKTVELSTIEGDCYKLRNIDISTYNSICTKLAKDGYVDVTEHGEIE